jgi:hypothetical protein
LNGKEKPSCFANIYLADFFLKTALNNKPFQDTFIPEYIQSFSGGKVNILGSGTMDYSE